MTEGRVKLEPYDWRYSAAIVGLARYFEWLEKEQFVEVDWEKTEDTLEYHREDIQKSYYLKFVEEQYEEDMHHRLIEKILDSDEYTEEQINFVNEKMKANTILKKIFKGIKFDGTNTEEVRELIITNREQIIEETFKNKSNLYRNYSNPNQFFKEGQECCRLNGYYVDMGKKGKSISYNFEKSNFLGQDLLEFDFIPFAFAGMRETFFINLNCNVKNLIQVNNEWNRLLRESKQNNTNDSGKVKTKQVLVDLFLEAGENLIRDVEVIVKKQDQDYFETLYIRQSQLEVLKTVKEYHKKVCFSFKIGKDYWIDIYERVFYGVLNGTLLDDTINILLKNSADGSQRFAISQLIRINIAIKGKQNMENCSKSMQVAFACAKQIAEKRDRIADNKLKSYCNKMINALVLDDYDRFQKLLINLSSYTEVSCGFAYDLFENFEENKELAYTFVNALNRYEGTKQS